MSFKPRERVFLLAAVLAIAAATMVWTIRSTQEPTASAQAQVVTAAGFIPSGSVLTTDKLAIRSFPEALPGTAENEGLVIGKVAKIDIKAGDPIRLSDLATKDRLSYVVPRGMRAVTVGLDPVSGVGGFLKPGDRVDIVATFEMNSSSFAKTVLQNVTLLAIGTQSQEGDNLAGDKATAKAQPTATLAVSPTDAEKLILADAKGRLRLALRAADDRLMEPRKPVSAQMVMGVSQTPQKPAAPQPTRINTNPPVFGGIPPMGLNVESNALPREETAAKPSGKTIVVVRGTTTSETVVPE